MANYEALFEDEDNIFGGTPQSKYHDIANQANNEIVEDELEKIIERYAYMEILLSKDKDFNFDVFEQDYCPLCKDGSKAIKPGSRGN